MRVTVKARHMELTSALKTYAIDKICDALTRILNQPAASIEIELSTLGNIRNQKDKECRVTIFMPHRGIINICEVGDNMYKCIDLAHDRVMRQISRHQLRAMKRGRKRRSAARERASIRRANMTTQPELWEEEVAMFERSQQHKT